MSRLSSNTLRKYLLAGQISHHGCLRRPIFLQPYARLSSIRCLTTNESPANPDHKPIIPLRKELKDEKKRRKLLANEDEESLSNKQSLEDWELTVGIEIHAQLNTPRKLFSPAASTIGSLPNSHVALFDVAIPGTQPNFQKETLVPAIRAALALNCHVQPTSTFDRKHYFHWDQPHGYQITQYYQPFAKDGYITLYKHDGIANEDGDEIRIGIKQIQMEQDTAKTVAKPGNIHLIDFNRVGVPLIEIITLPQIHYPATAAAFVRKVQTLLNAVDACVLGMESGGLRADINVSVKRRNPFPDAKNTFHNTNSYAGITNLGTRTEIKNLSSHKAVEAAIIAERNRQIAVIEADGVVESETRGWTLGSTETKRLRGKEGEVDYRYMPDADIPPIHIGNDLISHLRSTLGVLPDKEIEKLTTKYNLSTKDALSLVTLENGARAEYFYEIVDELAKLDEADKLKALVKGTKTEEKLREINISPVSMEMKWGRIAGNWVLHELGGLISASDPETLPSLPIDPELGVSPPLPATRIPSSALAQILHHLSNTRITGKTAKSLLSNIFYDPFLVADQTVTSIIDNENFWFVPLSQEEYKKLAMEVIGKEGKAWEEVVKGGKGEGKIMFLVGGMMRLGVGDGRMDGKVAEGVVRALVGEERERREKGGT